MDFVTTLGTAATATTLLVAMFKLAFPSVPSYAVVFVALASGVGLSLLVALGQGEPLTAKTAATSVLAGIFAAAAAAGVRSADNRADEARADAKPPGV